MGDLESHTWGGTGIAGKVGESAPVVEALRPFVSHLLNSAIVAKRRGATSVVIELDRDAYAALRAQFHRPFRADPSEFTVYDLVPITFRRKA